MHTKRVFDNSLWAEQKRQPIIGNVQIFVELTAYYTVAQGPFEIVFLVQYQYLSSLQYLVAMQTQYFSKICSNKTTNKSYSRPSKMFLVKKYQMMDVIQICIYTGGIITNIIASHVLNYK